jgi:4-hydroxyacetophenone monooxygenase
MQRISESDEDIRRALDDAFLPALIPALAQATGDLSLLREDIRPPGLQPGVPQGGMTEAQQAAAKEVALEAIRRVRDGAALEPCPLESCLKEITAWMTGTAASDDYLPLLVEEFAADGEDPRAPGWRMDPATKFSAVVVGAGMSGILAAIRLKQAGIPFTIIEKSDDVGGTWHDNTYPGVRVDVPNAFYSYSFAQKHDWPKFFSEGRTLQQYFRACAEEFGVFDRIRFNTEVLSMSWDDERALWSLRLRAASGDGAQAPSPVEETLEANAVVSATGQLNVPKFPQIKGMETFAGPSFHSARWDHGVDLRGKRVAVIGTGASAAQFVPVVAEQAAHLTVFQRTPNWFIPVPTYHDDVPAGLQWLFSRVPYYAHWYRFWMFWNSTEGMLPAATVDPEWPDQEKSVSQANEMIRVMLGMYMQGTMADRPDLAEKIMPTYPPSAKRIILENGSFFAALKRENVELVTDQIKEITPDSVVTEDGTSHAADVIIYGTGFQASRFLTPMTVTGRGGADINKQWDGDASAYLGITVPNFPNFFMLYGPNTNIVVNGSIIFFSECEVQYIMSCLRLLATGQARSLDVRREVHDAYVERINAANLQRTWGASKVNAWYKNEKGRVTQNWPFNLIEYWRITREVDVGDYGIDN